MNTKHSRYPLGCFPTPIHNLENIGRILDIDLRIKREDLSGLAAGGNKVRKLEYLIADAKAKQATTLITAGAHQSNHVLQTVAAARKAGMGAIALLPGPPPEKFLGNLLLDRLLGAEIEFRITDRFFEDVPEYMSSVRTGPRMPAASISRICAASRICSSPHRPTRTSAGCC